MRQENTVAVVAGAETIDATMIQASANLKIIAMHGVGLNHINQKAARANGVAVKAVPGGNAEAVADLAWGLMIAVARKIVIADQAIRAGNWQDKYIRSSLNDKTLGSLALEQSGKLLPEEL